MQGSIEMVEKFLARPTKKRCDGTPTQKRKKCWQNYKKQKRHARRNVQMKHQKGK